MRRALPPLFALLVLAAVLRITFYFVILYFLAAVYLLARWWLRRAMGRLTVRRRFTDRVFHGEEVPVEIDINNGSLLPLPWLELRESTPPELTGQRPPETVVTLGPRGHAVLAYTLLARRRGYYEIGPLSVHGGDVLDTDHRQLMVPEPRPLIVYPRIVPLARPTLPSRSALVALPARSPLFEDPSRVVGVRDYRRGDSPRRIHWTASARAGALLVKQLSPAIARDTLLCLDLDTNSFDRRFYLDATEMAVVVAASLAHQVIVVEGLAAGLLSEAGDPKSGSRRTFLHPPRRERSHLVGILETLARVRPATDASLAALLRRQRPSLPWGATLVLICGSISSDLAETALLLRRAGLSLSTALIRPPGRGAEAQLAVWRATGLPIRRIWTDSDLAAWR